MTNSRSIQRLEDDLRARWPGITVYDIGDVEHAEGVSGHNPDDTTLPQGGRAEDTDADSLPEVRALDPMIRGPFTPAAAAWLFEALTRRPANQARLLYVIYNRRIRSRSDGWRDRAYTGSNPHTDHVHISGRAEDDDNASPWDIQEEDMALTPDDADLVVDRLLARTITSPSFPNGAVTVRDLLKQPMGAVQRLDALSPTITEARAGVGELVDRPVLTAQAVADLVLAGLVEPDDDAAVADALRAVLGDRAAAVGALLAAS